jgi:hypothetical protein
LKVTIQQAAANAAVVHLRNKFPSDLSIHARWPSKDFPGKAITLITAGARQDRSIQPRILKQQNVGDTQTSAVWQIAECTQPFQLDVWATSWDERDDLMASLDEHLRSGAGPMGLTFYDPVESGFWVPLQDGWEDSETTARFSFSSPDIEDSPESVGRRQYRATYRGVAWMSLALPAVTYRLKTFHLQAFLNGEEEPFE